LKDERPFKLVAPLPPVEHIDHVVWTRRTVAQSLIGVGVVAWFAHEPPHRLFDEGDGIIIGMKLFACGNVDPRFAEDILAKLPVQLPLSRLLRRVNDLAPFFAVAVEITQVERIVSAHDQFGPPQPRTVITDNLAKSAPDFFGAFVVSDSQLYFVPCLLGAHRQIEPMAGRVNDQNAHGG
jgi:hypothetical protein